MNWHLKLYQLNSSTDIILGKVQCKVIHCHQEKHVKGNRIVQNYLW